MSATDRDRLKVLHEVRRGHRTQKEGGEQLGVTDRWVRELVARMRKEGDGGILHRLRGRASNRKIAEKTRRKAVKLVEGKCRDFGPPLASEYLGKREAVKVSKETLRQWLIEAGVWKRKKRRVEEVHEWRPRRSCRGEFVQGDTSEHDWLEGRGEKLYRIALIDDAGSRLLGRFVRHDSTEENLRVLRSYLERWGRPRAFYTDQAGLFQVNRPASREEQRAGEEARTQIGGACGWSGGWTGRWRSGCGAVTCPWPVANGRPRPRPWPGPGRRNSRGNRSATARLIASGWRGSISATAHLCGRSSKASRLGSGRKVRDGFWR